jgi:hypothetical protein
MCLPYSCIHVLNFNTTCMYTHRILFIPLFLPKPIKYHACELLLLMRKCPVPLPVHDVCSLQLFYSFFKSLVGKEVIVELKNDLRYALLLMIDHVIASVTY